MPGVALSASFETSATPMPVPTRACATSYDAVWNRTFGVKPAAAVARSNWARAVWPATGHRLGPALPRHRGVGRQLASD
ncbi:MAG TPA: hypothetical protein VK659_05305 [Asanoa sp.]|nr:hypothetical protein [Asanoa sp.]